MRDEATLRRICYIPYCREKNRCIRVHHRMSCQIKEEPDWSIRMAKAAMNDRTHARLAVDNDSVNDEWLTRWIGKTILVSCRENGGELSEVEVLHKNKNAIRIKWIVSDTAQIYNWVDPLGFCTKYIFFEEIVE